MLTDLTMLSTFHDVDPELTGAGRLHLLVLLLVLIFGLKAQLILAQWQRLGLLMQLMLRPERAGGRLLLNYNSRSTSFSPAAFHTSSFNVSPFLSSTITVP